MQDGITEVFYKDHLEDFGFYLRIAREHETSLTPAPMKRALLVEDDKAQAKFLQCVLADLGYQAVLASTAEEAMAQVEAEDWHLAVVDLVLAQGQSGNAVIRYIRSHGLRNRMPIVVISGLLDEARRVEALRSGANLYVEKPIQADTLGLYIRNLEAIHGGGQQNGDAGLGDRIRSLTERERSVYELMAGGHSDKQIAERLGISFWTVRTHAGRIFRKFDVTNRVELIRKSSSGQGAEAALRPADPESAENGGIAACMQSVIGDAQQLIASASQLSASSHTVAESSETQSQATSSAAAAIEEMTVSVDHIGSNAEDAAGNAEEAGRIAQGGGDVARSAAKYIDEVKRSVEVTSRDILVLSDQVQKIGSIAVVIKDVADQTNLLALNAAIEAARAGEQGRGFAVVADEVRKLAERTTKSVQDISSTIATIANDAQSVVASMVPGPIPSFSRQTDHLYR